MTMEIFQWRGTENDRKQATHITKYHVRYITGELQT